MPTVVLWIKQGHPVSTMRLFPYYPKQSGPSSGHIRFKFHLSKLTYHHKIGSILGAILLESLHCKFLGESLAFQCSTDPQQLCSAGQCSVARLLQRSILFSVQPTNEKISLSFAMVYIKCCPLLLLAVNFKGQACLFNWTKTNGKKEF